MRMRSAIFIATLALVVACDDDGTGDDLPPGAFTSGPGDTDSVADDVAIDESTTGDPTTTGDSSPDDDDDTGPPPEVSFDAEVQPLFAMSCLGSLCHEGMTPAGTLALDPEGAIDPYTELTTRTHGVSGMPYVTQGEPSQSYMYRKLEGTHAEGDLENLGSGVQMPSGQPPLSDEDLTLVRNWILSGAMP
jgi:hypothetical protein